MANRPPSTHRSAGVQSNAVGTRQVAKAPVIKAASPTPAPAPTSSFPKVNPFTHPPKPPHAPKPPKGDKGY